MSTKCRIVALTIIALAAIILPLRMQVSPFEIKADSAAAGYGSAGRN
jgi:hypothetical protein